MRASTALTAALLFGVTFVGAPAGLVRLNEAYGWPRWQSGVSGVVGSLLMFAGIGLAIYCGNLFRRVGEGTPVPTEPPKRLVISGLYRYSRNPLFVAHIAFLLGLFLYRGEITLLVYAVTYAAFIHAWIVLREEPELGSRFGEEYLRYMQEVPRWVGLRRPPE